MRLATLRISAFLWVCAVLALHIPDAFATGDDEASSSGAGPSRSYGKPPLPPIRLDGDEYDDLTDIEDHINVPLYRPTPRPIIPPITALSTTPEEREHLLDSFKNRLEEYGRPRQVVTSHGPALGGVATHLEELHARLQQVSLFKLAVFLGPTPDRRGRLIAVPLYKQEILTQLAHGVRVGPQWTGWALLRAYSTSAGITARIEWHNYAMHFEPDPLRLVSTLRGSADVRSLAVFLKRPL